MMRILVIEDHDLLRKVTVQILTSEGYDVVAADGGLEGLRLWREHGADLVLTDFRLADLDGTEVIRQLRAAAPGIPVLLVSGDGQYLLEDGAIPDGVSILQKPYQRAQLIAAVAKALAPPPGTASEAP
jgi:CheY-like chemotaxis protein